MITGLPMTTQALLAPRASSKPVVAATGTWRYHSPQRSRIRIASALLISAGLHAGVIFGIRSYRDPAPPAPAAPTIELAIVIPKLEELEPAESLPADDAAPIDAGALVPMQADLPTIAAPTDFVQQIDFSTLVEKPDLSDAKVMVIPEHIRRGPRVTENFGKIFNLADLDRQPEPIVQPAPVVPAHLKRLGETVTVRVEFIVDTEGRVMSPVVIESTNTAFNDTAANGVLKWKFRAGVRGGRRVNSRMHVPIVFRVIDLPD